MAGIPFLSNLGVSDVDQARHPTAQAFPPTFNPNCRSIWDSTISQLEVLDTDVGFTWGHAIRQFIASCIDQDLYPFSGSRQGANDQIFTELQDARKQVVKFLNQSKMLKYVDLRVTRREVEMSTIGFTLRCLGIAYLKDPTFEKWLMQMPMPAFRIKHAGRYLKHLSNSVTMVVYNEGNHRWHVGYEIVVRRFPDLPGKHVPSKAELETFILDVLWMPVLRSHRPLGYHHRLI